MARLYADENFHFDIVVTLRGSGHDVLTSRDAGHAGRGFPDEDVLAFATVENRAVLTFNRGHFIRLHSRSPQHAGIIVCSYDNDWQALAGRIDSAIQGAGPLAGQLIRVNKPHK